MRRRIEKLHASELSTSRLAMEQWKIAAEAWRAIPSDAREAACRAARNVFYRAACGTDAPPLRAGIMQAHHQEVA